MASTDPPDGVPFTELGRSKVLQDALVKTQETWRCGYDLALLR